MHPLASVLFLTLSVPFGTFIIPWTCSSLYEKTWDCCALYFLGFGKSWCLTVVWPLYNHVLLSCLNSDAKFFLAIFTQLQSSYSLVYFLLNLVLLLCFFPLKSFLWGDDFIIWFQSHLSLWFLNYFFISSYMECRNKFHWACIKNFCYISSSAAGTRLIESYSNHFFKSYNA